MITQTETEQQTATATCATATPRTGVMDASRQSDDETIRLILEGDRQAFGELASKYQERLYNSLTYLLQDRSEAEDVVQEALAQAYFKLSTFRHEGSFYTWLYRIAWNIACTKRRRRRREVSLDQFCEASGTEPADEKAIDVHDQHDSIYRVRKALGDVGERFRTVLVLRHLEGYSYETIADILKLPVGTVRSRIHRGRSELRRKLEVSLRPVQ